ncbi:MAG TPA: nucleotidyltransferase family protein [Gammaproteobacteria bacterium]|nr:nucleotidyltransferase family protein [Gammaproteobacteria bacterium]
MSSSIVGILLAAGQSTRFGRNKLLHLLNDGTPMVLASARHLHKVLPQTIVVVEDASNDVAKILAPEGVQVVENPLASEGMGTGIACAVANSPDARGWVIALADMPCIPTGVIQAVVTGLEQDAGIVAPVYKKMRGHPVGFSARYAQALMQLHSDEGARSVIQANSDSLELIETTERGVIVDFDTPGACRT